MRPRISIRGSVRPSVRRSETRAFKWSNNRLKWSEMNRKTVYDAWPIKKSIYSANYQTTILFQTLITFKVFIGLVRALHLWIWHVKSFPKLNEKWERYDIW